ncbi:MAG: glycosyltransferase family protein [Gluconacetobacter diazotrophicus]|nr:glycosyltransferase family protein [Gluconacetobacter diazotrophicus]
MESATIIPFRFRTRIGAAAVVEDWIRDERRDAGNRPEELADLGAVLFALGRFGEADTVLRRAVGIDPRCRTGWSRLGDATAALRRYPEAAACFCRALAIEPDHGSALRGLGAVLTGCGAPAEAMPFLDRAVRLEPDDAEARLRRARALLAAGRWAEGFAEEERCRRSRDVVAGAPPDGVPRWDGSAFAGRTLLLHEEDGVADTLLALRYLPMVKERGGSVLLRVRPALSRLVAGMPGVDRVVAEETLGEPGTAGVAWRASLRSLPRLFGTGPDTVPGAGGYLSASRGTAAGWRRRLDDRRASIGVPPLRIGLAWEDGAPAHRLPPLGVLAPLARAVPDAQFHLLREGGTGGRVAQAPDGMRLVDHPAVLDDLAEAAGLMAALDLVVAVDGAAAHLAAAMNRPTWLLLPFEGGWPWHAGRDDTPWYGSMRLFRQPEPFDWETPVARVAAALRELAVEHDP